jgi:energy-coupling factor transporter ATP-binding protein EcfA2
VIEVRGLTERYGSTVAAGRLSFDVPPGAVTGFPGLNGSGKSTTMRMILGLDAPDAGHARIGGQAYRQLRWPLREAGGLLESRAFHPGRSARAHLAALAASNSISQSRVAEVPGDSRTGIRSGQTGREVLARHGAASRHRRGAAGRPGHQPSGRYRFRQLARMEWVKLRSLRSTWLTLAIAVAGSAGIALALGSSTTSGGMFVGNTLVGMLIGVLLTGVVGVLAMTSEYTSGTIRVTFAAAPRRLGVLAAKAAVVGALALITGEAAAFLSFFAGRMTLRHGITPPALSPVSCGRSCSPEPASA